ncbi:MAG: glutathione S-transferase family protein [Pseudomonadota bacterium]
MNETGKPILYGAEYSVYVKIVQLVLAEKHIDYELVSVDVFSDSDIPDSYLKRSPFGKIPSFSHADVEIFETSAIVRYVDETFPNPPLMPELPNDRARVNQIVSIIDNYAYPSMVWGVYVPLEDGKPLDNETGEFGEAITLAETTLDALARLCGSNSPFAVDDRITLADFYMLPTFFYFSKTDVGRSLINGNSRICNWFNALSEHPGYRDILEAE